MILTIFSKVLGFGKELVLSYFYGTSGISDAYIVSLTIPTVIFSFIGVAINTTYIPIYNSIEENDGEKNALRFTSNLINLMLILLTILIVLVFIFTTPIVRLFASGFEGEILRLSSNLTRISIISIYFSGIIYILQGYLQIKNDFRSPALIGIPLNIILIISIIISNYTDTLVLGYGNVVAVLCQVIFLVPFLIKQKYRHEFIINYKDEKLIRAIYLAVPVMLGTSVNQINQIVDRTIASNIVVGGISALNYANRLNLFIQGIFVASIATVFYAEISKKAAKGDLKGIKSTMKSSLTGVNFIILPITFGTMVFARQIVELLFGRGAFDQTAITYTAAALFFYSIGMVGFGLREVLSRVFYSLQDTRTPMINAALGMLLNIILNIVLSRYLGIGGLALATSIAAIFTTALLFISLRKKTGPFGMKQISISFLKILFASSLMGGLAKLSFNYLTISLSQNLSLLIAIGVGALSYFVIIYFMKIEDVDVIVGAIKKKLGRGAA